MDTIGNILSDLPQNFFADVGENHLDGMAKFSTYVGAVNAVSGDPVKGVPDISQTDLEKFGNWTGQTNNRVMAKSLMDMGLLGADQLLFDQVDTSSADKIRNAQSDWELSATQNILRNAKKFGIRTPEQVEANKDILIGNAKWAEGINSDSFKNVHGNYWDIIKYKLLPQQYAKFDSQNKKQTALK